MMGSMGGALGVKWTLRAAVEVADQEVSGIFNVQILLEIGNAFKDSHLPQPNFGELRAKFTSP
jgi:hypothetical protein